MRNDVAKSFAAYNLNHISQRLAELRATKPRKIRSINWLGSAWKWVAGSPDATDWDTILRSQNDVIANSNHQFKINEELFNATRESMNQINQMTRYVNTIGKEVGTTAAETVLLNRIQILKEEISEVVRACQMAKSGIVNTNLLNPVELHQLISEEEALPYQNAIEAIEYAKPSLFSNGSLLLYVLAIPKVRTDEFRFLMTRAAVHAGMRVVANYTKMLVSKEETYGIISECPSIKNSTICEMSHLQRLPEDGCLARLIKGGDAECHFEPENGETIELISEGTLFLTNFQGTVRNDNRKSVLNGTFLIQFSNETIWVKNETFSNRASQSSQVLPAAVTNVKSQGFKPSLEYVHELSMTNINHLGKLGQRFHVSLAVDAFFICILAVVSYWIWRKITASLDLPPIRQPTIPMPVATYAKETPDDSRNTHVNLRDADI
ncbi:uncharacterized protein LOC128869498 [Anastrepha ludens]|uniref:uncharacterized protein LOC128869498 n=1 Tax=Anastrepha ludens TaxID=28586 RepID=UPI0023AFDC0D|nr:uncharacterized protein LOC128869498 [Anastrepha ludens]